MKEQFDGRPVDCVEVKGRDQPVVFYELLGRLGDVDDARTQAAAALCRALDLYLARTSQAARRAFREVLDVRPADVAPRELIGRCERYEREPPPERLDGRDADEPQA